MVLQRNNFMLYQQPTSITHSILRVLVQSTFIIWFHLSENSIKAATFSQLTEGLLLYLLVPGLVLSLF